MYRNERRVPYHLGARVTGELDRVLRTRVFCSAVIARNPSLLPEVEVLRRMFTTVSGQKKRKRGEHSTIVVEFGMKLL